MAEEDECGEEKISGERCSYPPKYPDGKCGYHTDHETGPDFGRPTEFNDERAKAAIEAVRIGKSKSGAARAAAVTSETIDNWCSQGHTFINSKGEAVDFFEAFSRARAEGETKLVEGGLDDPDVNSTFAKFLLSSSYDYVEEEKQQVEHSGEIDGLDFTINAGADN